MGLFGWIHRKKPAGGGMLDDWRRRWQLACGAPTRTQAEALATALDALGLPEEEIEIEREMLAGLEQLLALHDTVAAGLPIVQTGHRVVGADVCHFTAPASMPDEPSQPSGRLILTSDRAIFAGGAKATTMPWHAIGEVLHQERDLVLVRHGRETFHRFRCNVFADALSATYLAQRLAASHRRQRSV
jgi:hypothetical protein